MTVESPGCCQVQFVHREKKMIDSHLVSKLRHRKKKQKILLLEDLNRYCSPSAGGTVAWKLILRMQKLERKTSFQTQCTSYIMLLLSRARLRFGDLGCKVSTCYVLLCLEWDVVMVNTNCQLNRIQREEDKPPDVPVATWESQTEGLLKPRS